MTEIDKFKQEIAISKRILITSHISPDPDALSSILLLGTTLKANFPDKQVVMVLEEEPEGLDFVTGYGDIRFGSLLETTKQTKPDLFIILDAVNYERCSRTNGQELRQYLTDSKVVVTIIDHHEPTGKDKSDVYIHQASIATTQDVYEVCFEHLKLRKPDGYEQTTMLGIYSDSGGFTYANRRHKATFAIINELIDQGADIESIKNKLNNYSRPQMQVIGEFAKNVSNFNDYSYSFLSDDFVKQWETSGQSLTSLNTAAGVFVNEYIRNIEGRKWGFVIYLCPLINDNSYSVSFRAQTKVKDVSKIANKLGGGGHKPAAGAQFTAKSLQEALDKVKQAILLN